MPFLLGSTPRILGLAILLPALVLPVKLPSGGLGTARAQTSEIVVPHPKPAESPSLKKRMAIYRKQLAAYKKARAVHDRRASPYWKNVSRTRTKRRRKRNKGGTLTLKDYVLTQPPIYKGPGEPRNPKTKRRTTTLPVVADFLRYAKRHFDFVPEKPSSEIAYKRAYAQYASAAGLTKEACVKVYGFESGGNGKYDVQAGLEYGRPGERAISTALGYNQLLTANTIGLVAEHGNSFVTALKTKAKRASGPRKVRLEDKIKKLRRMIRFTKSVPYDWYKHVRLGRTDKGRGVHALNLDIDIGPMLQTHKLLNSVRFAKRLGYNAPLTAAELEMMNLTGDGNGIDMVLMPEKLRRKIPTSNFFLQRGYERNPVAIRNNTVAKLIGATDAKMVRESRLQGARDMAAAFDAVARND